MLHREELKRRMPGGLPLGLAFREGVHHPRA
jgi:hypothetical protein